jgi:hypothetical protein
MTCYCKEITKLEKDISTLESMSSKLGSLVTSNTTNKTTLKTLAAATTACVAPQNASVLTDKLENLGNKTATGTQGMKGRVSGEITRLKAKLSQRKAQDKLHHDSESDE